MNVPSYMYKFIDLEVYDGPDGSSLWVNGKCVAGLRKRSGKLTKLSVMRATLNSALWPEEQE